MLEPSNLPLFSFFSLHGVTKDRNSLSLGNRSLTTSTHFNLYTSAMIRNDDLVYIVAVLWKDVDSVVYIQGSEDDFRNDLIELFDRVDGYKDAIDYLTASLPAQHDPDDICPESPDGRHKPDWKTVTTQWDGDDLYVDVNCERCGRSGCVGNAATLIENISW